MTEIHAENGLSMDVQSNDPYAVKLAKVLWDIAQETTIGFETGLLTPARAQAYRERLRAIHRASTDVLGNRQETKR